MDDLEQQIKAWADASAPATGEAVGAADVIDGRVPSAVPVGQRPRRGAWLAAAAVVLVAALVGVGIAVGSGDDGSEPVIAEQPPATLMPGEEVAFEVLGVLVTGANRIGLLESAQTPAELSRMWAAGTPESGSPVPEVDFDQQVVVGITIADDACPPDLASFRHEGTTISPRFVEADQVCEQPLIPKTFLVALDWDTTGDEFLLLVNGLRPEDDQETLLVVRGDVASSATTTAVATTTTEPAPVTSTTTTDTMPPTTTTVPQTTPLVSSQLDLAGTAMSSGGELKGTIVIVNNSGEPIVGSSCGPYFVAVLANSEYRQEVISPGCGGSITIPEGRSSYPVQILGSYTSCTTSPDSPDDRACDPDGSLPGLPPGEYQLTIGDPQRLVPAITPVTITVT